MMSNLFCVHMQVKMHDPVIAADGYTYERAAIARWVELDTTSPSTGELLSHTRLLPNLIIRSLISQESL